MTRKAEARPKKPMPASVRAKLREIVRKAPWKASTAPEYRLVPHSYVVFFDSVARWKALDRAIRRFGETRVWIWPGRRSKSNPNGGKVYRHKYLILGPWCYWSMWPILNRSKAATLQPRAKTPR
jgi:hypothetical protein